MDGEGDSDGSSSGEHQLPSTPRKRGQTINTYMPAYNPPSRHVALQYWP